MLSGDAIQKVVDLSKYEMIDDDGVKFHVNHKGSKEFKYPIMDSFPCFSLTQLMNFLEAVKIDDGKKLCINVLSYNRVQVVLPSLNKNKSWDIIAESDFSDMIESFPFGEKMSQEDFIINLMTKFKRDDELTKMLSLASNIKGESLSTSDDDGYSQVASTKTGVHLTAQEKVKNIWDLKTYKTFPEIEQPTITYILRLHQRSEETPRFALYDCDGGRWRVDTAIAIRTWITNYLKSDGKGIFEKVIVL